MMTIKIFFSLLFLVSATTAQANSQKAVFDRSAFYAAMASDMLSEINEQLIIVKGASINEKEAYEGALLMKKAGLVSKAKEKLSLFKAGRLKLEAAIKKESTNTEYYFLRLIIQENAPKIVKYRDELESDSAAVRSNYKSLSPVVQKAIMEYSKKSKFLKLPQP
ncbi:MAG TPA: hypothetical protein VK489_03705 [Ferruginibacter sp.]|nr:hypothetical protein [Ferruginibacter sp.]